MEDAHKVRKFGRKLQMAAAYAMLEPQLKRHLVGRGITLVKVKVDKVKMEEVTAYWTTAAGAEERDEAEVALERHKEEIRAAMEMVADVGKVRKLAFERGKLDRLNGT